MSVVNVAGQRQALVEVLEGAEDLDVVVYRAAPVGAVPRELVVVGMPQWEPGAAVGWATVTWQLMVAVSRLGGTNDLVVAERLEELWPQVLQVLDDAVETDPSLGGVCCMSEITRAEFAPVTIAGQEMPAQIITIRMQGA